IELDGDVLVLEGGDTRIEYLDREIATPDLPLVGPTWTVDTVIQGESAGASPWPDPATLVFTAEGTVEVFTGCNHGTASYQVSGTSITFADLVLDEMECTEQTIVILDDTVQGVLGGPQPVEWEVSVRRLWLNSDDLGLGLLGSEE